MARTIWKFLLRPGEPVVMPAGARPISAREQHDTICVWAEVDPAAPMEPRHFGVYGTGHALPDDPGRFLGTASLHGGRLIFHVYEPPAEAS